MISRWYSAQIYNYGTEAQGEDPYIYAIVGNAINIINMNDISMGWQTLPGTKKSPIFTEGARIHWFGGEYF